MITNKELEPYIGIEFKRPNKEYTEKVIDYRITYNSKNEIVDRKLVASHKFVGSTVIDYEVPISLVFRYRKEGDTQ